MIAITQENIQDAVKEWCRSPMEAKEKYGDISNWDVSKVTNMSYMCLCDSSFNGDISNWDVSKVTNMSYMFRYAYSFNGDLSNWDVSNVTNMASMFWNAKSFNGDLSKWDVSNVKYMMRMFYDAKSYKGDNEGTLRKKAANWNRRKNALIALQDVKTSRVLSLFDLKRYIVSYL